MDFTEIAKRRFSCRNYQDKKVEEDKIAQILEAARIAPSAKNLQPWHFVVVQDPENLEKVKSCYARDWISSAPMIVIACGDHKGAWYRADGKNHADIDVAIATDHLTLTAADLGLGTCWVCKFDVQKCAHILQLPEGIEPIAMIPIGYPMDQPDTERHERQRKSLQDIVHNEKFHYKYFKR
ncbi:MAG: nitroreductase family protein [Bacteroidales bacterium]